MFAAYSGALRGKSGDRRRIEVFGRELWRVCVLKLTKLAFLANLAKVANQKISKLRRINTQRHNESLFLRSKLLIMG